MVGTYTPTPDSAESWESAPVAPPRQQTTWQRFSAKFKQEPLVPIGAPPPRSLLAVLPAHAASLRASAPLPGIVATVAALLGATSALQKGNRVQFNKFLRYRVAAQGVTVIAALGAFPCSLRLPL